MFKKGLGAYPVPGGCSTLVHHE